MVISKLPLTPDLAGTSVTGITPAFSSRTTLGPETASAPWKAKPDTADLDRHSLLETWAARINMTFFALHVSQTRYRSIFAVPSPQG